MKQKISFIPNLFALSALYLLAGCASVLMDSELSTDNIKNLNENFTIEGKFKLSYSDSKETGYFDLKKYKPSLVVLEFIDPNIKEFFYQKIENILVSELYNYMINHDYKMINWIHDDLVFVPKNISK